MARSKKVGVVSVDKFVDEVTSALNECFLDVSEAVKNAEEDAGDVAKQYLWSNSPRDSGDYARSWESEISYRAPHSTKLTVFSQAPHYRLTHLLENPHVIANQFGRYRKSDPIPHISIAQQKAEETFMASFRREMS